MGWKVPSPIKRFLKFDEVKNFSAYIQIKHTSLLKDKNIMQHYIFWSFNLISLNREDRAVEIISYKWQ